MVGASEKLFDVDVAKEQQSIEADLAEARARLAENLLQKVRASLRLAEDRLARIKKEVPRAKRQEIHSRIGKVRGAMRHKEDSLVNATRDVLKARGMDAAIEYSQRTLRRHGLPEPRFEEVDRIIMTEGPMLEKAQEERVLAQTIEDIERGRSVDHVDPFIVKTAQRMVKARADSVRAVRAQAEASAQAEEREKRERDRARAERERSEAEARQREADVEREQATRERADRERQKHEAEQQRLAALEKEKERLARERADKEQRRERQEAELAELKRTEQARRAEEQERKKAEEYAAKFTEQERAKRVQERQKAEEEERKRAEALAAQLAEEQQAKEEQVAYAEPRTPSQQKEQRRTEDAAVRRAEEERRAMAAKQREERVAAQRREEQRLAELEALDSEKKPVLPPHGPTTGTRSMKEYMKKRESEKKSAQQVTMRIYELIDAGKTREAVTEFRARRAYIAEYVSNEVFTVLEEMVVQAAMEKPAASASAGVPAARPPAARKPKSEEEAAVIKINGYIKQQKFAYAVKLFDDMEPRLKKSMPRKEFKKLRDMVDNVRQYVPGGGEK
jgi:hypothetical protein